MNFDHSKSRQFTVAYSSENDEGGMVFQPHRPGFASSVNMHAPPTRILYNICVA